MHQLKDFRKITPVTVSQSIFLTLKYFLSNGLFSYASACSFDLLFSAIPLFMMVVSFLTRFLNVSPELIKSIFDAVPELENILTPEEIINIAGKIESSIHAFDVIILIFIIWMARRFFASVFAAMRRIFHDQQKRKPLLNQVLAVAFEFIVVTTAIGIIFGYMSLKTIVALPFFQQFPQLSFIFDSFLSDKTIAIVPNFLIFAVISLLYKGAAGTKPSWRLCLTSGFLCTGSFWVFRLVIHIFLNTTRYDQLYSVFASLIIVMMDLFFFFVFFLFFAQFIFTFQFFDDLLLGEVYLLPAEDEVGKFTSIYRKLFIRPDFLLAKYSSVTYYVAGEQIFEPKDLDDNAYYVLHGKVKVIRDENNTEEIYSQGYFFGELNCILNGHRTSRAIAVTDSQIVAVKGDTFRLLVEQNPRVAQEVLGQVSSYFTKVYAKKTSENVL